MVSSETSAGEVSSRVLAFPAVFAVCEAVRSPQKGQVLASLVGSAKAEHIFE